MVNSENVLNSRQLEQEIETFVHGFLKEKREIHSNKVIWQTSDEQMEKVENMEIPKRRTCCRRSYQGDDGKCVSVQRGCKSSEIFRVCTWTGIFHFLAWGYYDSCL